jgi:ABC-type branched-subunit amino acid transport system substrate-binding protein
MRIRTVRVTRGLAILLAFTLIAAACSDDDDSSDTTAAAEETEATEAAEETEATEAAEETEATEAAEEEEMAEGEPIVVGDLAYFTGDFGDIGAMLAAQVDFPVEIINEDPPLGRPFVVVHEDIGTVGEAQAARKLLEQDGAEVLVSAAHNYLTYRDFLLDWQTDNNGPLMPTVHGGAIPGNLGGEGTEPIFRAQGLDEGQGVTDVLYAESLGVETVVIITTPTSGYQLTADAIEQALPLVGIELLERIDAPGEQASYRTEVQRAVDLNPDAILIQGQAGESAVMVKQFAEAGFSTYIIGEAGWVEPDFAPTATPEAIVFHKAVVFPGFGFQDNEAWAFYQPLWDNNPDYNQFTAADDFYSYTTYDLMTVTALAIEAAGSATASDWAPAVFQVTEPPGTACYSYPECLVLIRAGEEIDYDGVTGPATYSGSGVNAVIPAIFAYGEDGAFTEEVRVDPARHLEILDQVAFRFEE